MKKVFFALIAGALLLSCSPDKKEEVGFVKVSNKKIVSPEGENILLRGYGIGGWMLQEGYMLKTRGPQHSIEARIEELIGKEKKEEFYDLWLKNHFAKIDVDSLASWGFNSIRPALHYKLFTPTIQEEKEGENTWNEKGFKMLDELISWSKENNLYLILDLHAAPGGQGEDDNISDYDRRLPSLWESEENKKKTIALWGEIARRYANEPTIIAYDLINEPNWGFSDHEKDKNGTGEKNNDPIWDLYKKITAEIRKVDNKHIIIIEGNGWGNNYNSLPELWDDNMVISFHKYWNSNSDESIAHMLKIRDERNVPIWLGETGENSNHWFSDAVSTLERHNIGWSWWPVKKLGFNNPYQVPYGQSYENILNYWNKGGEKPSEEQATEALFELVNNLKSENCIYHRDVVYALVSQSNNNETHPYKSHLYSDGLELVIKAVDYDMGKNGYAYNDADFQNISSSSGNNNWNRGWVYRNDGVDIVNIDNQFVVNHIEVGEWINYTFKSSFEGSVNVLLDFECENANPNIELILGEKTYKVENGSVKKVMLAKGANTFKILFNEELSTFKSITLK